MKRPIIRIDEALCNGCGDCVTDCPEGAIRLIDGKARLVGEMFCDGLGACVGACPTGAITVEEREAEPYDEERVLENIIPKGTATIKAHLEHLDHHGEDRHIQTALDLLRRRGIAIPEFRTPVECPGLRGFQFPDDSSVARGQSSDDGDPAPSQLRQWPIQLHLISPRSPAYAGRDLLVAADCTAFAAGDFHARYLKGRTLVIACPKLDSELDRYVEKLIGLIDEARVNTITVLRMQVPCCGGLVALVQKAAQAATRKVPVRVIIVDPTGTQIRDEWL